VKTPRQRAARATLNKRKPAPRSKCVRMGSVLTFGECLELAARYTEALEALERTTAPLISTQRYLLVLYAEHYEYWHAAAVEALMMGQFVVEDKRRVDEEIPFRK